MILCNLVSLPIASINLEGILAVPKEAQGIVLFAHGSGSSRTSPRNNFVAGVFQKERLATLLFDLLTAEEDELYQNRFEIGLLTNRLIGATNWVTKQPQTKNLAIGYFGASTGAAAALAAAAILGPGIGAIVSRGGRPDLAKNSLPKVTSPTLLIVGGQDWGVIELNQQAYQELKNLKKLEIVPGATHLFEEPGALKKVAELAASWFKKYLPPKT